MINAQDFQQALGLECLVSSSYDTWDIRSPELNRPGMQFCGFYEFFAFETFNQCVIVVTDFRLLCAFGHKKRTYLLVTILTELLLIA